MVFLITNVMNFLKHLNQFIMSTTHTKDSKTVRQDQIFLNKQEVANLLRCSVGTVNNLVSQGKLNPLGYNRIVIFNKQEVIDGLISRK
jgi:hypothetical protein